MSMILPDSLVIKAALDHHHDGLRKAFIALGEGPGLQHQPQLAKSRFCFRTLLTRFLSLSRTNSQKQRTTHHIKYRTSAFPFLLCILYVLVLFCFQVIIFAMPSMVNDLFPWMIFRHAFEYSVYSRFDFVRMIWVLHNLTFSEIINRYGVPGLFRSRICKRKNFAQLLSVSIHCNDQPKVLRLKISNPHKTTKRRFKLSVL